MRLLKICFFSLLVLACFGLGVVFEQQKIFPYFYAKEKYLKAEARVFKILGITKEQAVLSPAAEKPRAIPEREIYSGLLPLKIWGRQLNGFFPTASEGGAIAVIDDRVVVADRTSIFYVYNDTSRQLERLALPRVPDNREQFFAWGLYGPNSLFRIHDIEFMEADGKVYLLATHEYFDASLAATRMA